MPPRGDADFIIETSVAGAADAALPGARPSAVPAGTPFTFSLQITSEDGTPLRADTTVLVALHLCAWDHDLRGPSDEPGLRGFTSAKIGLGERWCDSLELTLPADGGTATLGIPLIAPVRDHAYHAILHAHVYLGSTGALVGHAARALTIVTPEDRHEERDALPEWPDDATEDDLRKGIGWVVLPKRPLPHPDVVLYVTSYRGHMALAASAFTPAPGGGNGTVRLFDLGRMDDPEELGCPDGVGGGFSLPAFLKGDGDDDYPLPSNWPQDVAGRAASCLRDKLPAPCRAFLVDRFATVDPAAPAPTLLVSTDDLLFPWELVRVTPDGAPTPRLLGQVAAVGRWLHHKPLPGDVRVRRAVAIAPESETISPSGQLDRDTLAGEESDLVGTFAAGVAATYERMGLCTIPSVIEALDSTDFQLLHLRSHGTKYGVQLAPPDGTFRRAVFSLRPKHLPGWDAERERRRPFVFVNVCGGAFLESERWLEALLDYGCGAAVVTLWNVASDLSKVVAARCYDRLATGDGIAEAIRSARALYALDGVAHAADLALPPVILDAMRKNPTPLSYIVLGHPAAKVVRAR